MTTDQLERFLDQLMGAQASQPFGPDAVVYKVKDKMFALLARLHGRDYVTLKAKPEDGEILSEQFNDITPGYHMNKRHWITVYFGGDVDDGFIEDLCEQSYRLVASKLTKVQRQSLGL